MVIGLIIAGVLALAGILAVVLVSLKSVSQSARPGRDLNYLDNEEITTKAMTVQRTYSPNIVTVEAITATPHAVTAWRITGSPDAVLATSPVVLDGVGRLNHELSTYAQGTQLSYLQPLPQIQLPPPPSVAAPQDVWDVMSD